jgi:hypothetical protein
VHAEKLLVAVCSETHLYKGVGQLKKHSLGKRQSFCIITVKMDMQKYTTLSLYVLILAMTLSSCEVVGGIFKAGFWAAIILVVIVVAIILWIVNRVRRR